MKLKHLLPLTLATLLLGFGSAQAQNSKSKSQICRIGLEYQMSYNENWGANRPIILSIEPNSPAALAGLKVEDIVESINGRSLKDLSEQEFVEILQGGDTAIQLEVSNFSYKKKSRTLQPECHDRSLLDERLLAQAFAFYSLEDESERAIVYPFDTGREGKTSFENFGNFAFADESKALSSTDIALNEVIRKQLEAKGLRYDASDPDIVIDTYYTLARNPYFDAKKAKNADKLWDVRIDPDQKSLVQVPFLAVGADKQLADYVLTMGIRIFNGRNLSILLWSCEAVEHLTEEFSIEEYARLSIPMMMGQFPFVRYNINPKWRIATHRHNYTGLYLRTSDLGDVAYVAPNSPAAKAGIRANDVIVAINEKPMAMVDQLNAAYRLFVENTLQYRDESTMFTNRNGVKYCRYWRKDSYSSIQKQLAKEKYLSIFSYLFGFRPYILGERSTPYYTFDVLSEGVTQRLNVMPELHDNSYITLD